jgi:hypothetical protein
MHFAITNRAKTHCQSSNHRESKIPKNGYKTQQQSFRVRYKIKKTGFV